MTLLRLLPRFRAAYRALAELERRERWPRADLEGLQLERLNRVWLHARAHVPYYRRLAGRLGLPVRFAGLAEFQDRVPLLHKQHVRENPRDFLSDRATPGHWTRTGGSTGTPMQVFWGKPGHL